MKYILILLLIHQVVSTNQSNTTTVAPNNTITSTTTVAPTTTIVPTTIVPTTTVIPTTTLVPTTTVMSIITTTYIAQDPVCSKNTTNSTCKICVGELCHSFTVEERGSMMELFFIVCVLSICGFIFLGLYYMCIKPILNNNSAEEILWSDTDSSDDEDFVETIQLIKRQHFKKTIQTPSDESV